MEQANFEEVKNAVMVNLLVKDIMNLTDSMEGASDPVTLNVIHKSVSLELAVLEDVYRSDNRFLDGYVHETVKVLLDENLPERFFVRGSNIIS